jgi:hypothetical protein
MKIICQVCSKPYEVSLVNKIISIYRWFGINNIIVCQDCLKDFKEAR